MTRLPDRSRGQMLFRTMIRWLVRFLVFLFVRLKVEGIEKFPRQGPSLVVINHLGDADVVIGIACWPTATDTFAKMELFDLPVLGWIFEKYGVIWVHRGQPDRRAIQAGLDGLKLGRIISIAPEGRESPTGALEQGTQGAAYLAWKSGAPVTPVAITGTENWRIYGNMKQLRKTDVTMTVGEAIHLPEEADRHTALETDTRLIMEALAQLLPEEKRGVYRYVGK